MATTLRGRLTHLLIVFSFPLSFLVSNSLYGQSFSLSFLKGESIDNPTSLQFGPDGRLYVTNLTGDIHAYTVIRNGALDYEVTATETIDLVKNIVNHDDDGTVNTAQQTRQITGLLLVGTPENPVMYVCSSDQRNGGGGGGTDTNLDTNSSTISRLTKTETGWEKVDIVRGLPRSEELHAANGLQLDPVNNILYLASGGNTNAGAPSNNFAFITEFALAGAVLSIDLTAIEAMPIKTDTTTGDKYYYDLPTLDDPTRANVNGIEDPSAAGYDGIDVNDPFGGNDGMNQAKLVSDGPVQIYAPGFRNAYDLVISETGKMYTWDNGANGGWGGHPANEGVGTATNEWIAGEPGSNGPGPNDAQVNNLDGLHLITGKGYYGGHPNPVRANPSGAGLFTHDIADGAGGANGVWRTQVTNDLKTTLPVDWPPVPLSMANPVEGDYQNPGVDDLSLYTLESSTNGLTEYTASNLGNSLKGDLLAASFNGVLYRVNLNDEGVINSNADVSTFASNFGSIPLDVTAQGDNDPFPGTVWAATYGSNNVVVFEPADYGDPLPPSSETEIYINAGGPTLTFGGITWETDENYFTNGKIFSTTHAIENTENDELYQTERFLANLSYTIPIADGTYEVALHFADIYEGTHSEGARVFDVTLEGEKVLENYDIFKEVGGFTATSKTFTVKITDAALNINFASVVENPKINAISITPKPQGAIYINSGGPEVTVNGQLWGADEHFTNGDTYSTANAIANTDADVLYQTERYDKNLAYAIPLDNGAYKVKLHFADIYEGTHSAGARVFDVSVEGELLLDDYDIFSEVGGFAAVVKQDEVQVTDGTLNIDFTSSKDNAKLSAIEIIPVINACFAADVNNEDDDGDGFTNADEYDNNTDPCNGADMPADFDGTLINGFKVSNLNDPDDDDDGIDDTSDFFAWDPSNGLNVSLPVEYPFLNGDPGYGFFGLGFTGLMTNYTNDYLELIKDETNSETEIIAGGAVGLFTLNGVPDGDAYSNTNSQYDAFQFGINVNSETKPFTIEAGMVGPVFSSPPNNYQSAGVFFGNGDQDNYVKVTVMANLGNPVIEIAKESNGFFSSEKVTVENIGNESELSLILSVDPLAGTAQAQYTIGSSEPVNIGALVTLSGPALEALQNKNQALAVGVIATTFASDANFNATWDYIDIQFTEEPVVPSSLIVPESILVSQLEVISLENGIGNQEITIDQIDFNVSENFSYKTYANLPITLAPEEIREFIEVSYNGIGGETGSIVIHHNGENGPTTEIKLLTEDIPFDTLGEVGQVDIDGNWKEVVLSQNYTDPVVVVSDLGLEGAQPALIRVRNVTPNSFELKIQEWSCMDQSHNLSKVTYMVIESGVHELPDGSIVQAENSTGVNHNWTSVAFSDKFLNAPVLVSQAVTYNGSDAITVRIRNKDTGGFQMKLQEDEGSDGSHTEEIVSWIAVSTGNYTKGIKFESGAIGGITQNLTNLAFKQQYNDSPLFIGKMASYAGNNPAVMRYDHSSLNGSGVNLQIQEEQCYDSEMNHVAEEVNYLVFDASGVLYGTLEPEPVCTNEDISITYTKVDADCEQANGSIDITANCTLSDCQITYSWEHGASSEDLTGLAPGTYTVTATISGGCTANATIVIEEDCQAAGTDVWLEAECADVGSNWTLYEHSLASGGKYLAPPYATSYNYPPTGTNDVVSFTFDVSEAGNYKVYARTYTTGSDSDSFWVRANGRSWVKWNLVNYPYNSYDFSWDRVSLWEGGYYLTPVVFALEAGENTIDFSWREPNALLDKIYVTLNGEIPVGFGETAVNCNTESGITETSVATASQTVLYPNPTSGEVNIEFSEEVNTYVDVEIYDTFGRLVQTEYFEMVGTKITFDLSTLGNGVYLIKLISPKGYYETQRVEISR